MTPCFKSKSRGAVAILTAAMILGAISPVFSAERSRITLTDNWRIRQLEPDAAAAHDPAALTRQAAAPDASWLSARMPAQVHDVLLQHGRISDPHVGKNAAESAWVGQKDWAYGCTFASPPQVNPSSDPANKRPVLLRFDGLDTLAEVYLNGRHVGSFNNMYRRWAVDVREQLAPPGKENVLLIVFASPLRYIERVQQLPEHAGVAKSHYLRKCHSDFGSYLGATPHSAKAGVFRDVWLDLPGRAWIDDVCVRTELSDDFRRATTKTVVETAGDAAAVRFVLKDPAGKETARGTVAASGNRLELAIGVDDPQLWWPRTHGTPSLYRLDLELIDPAGGNATLDARSISVGIRDIRPVLADPESGEKRFRFDVNGRPIFLRGADWAPLEGATHCWDTARAARLLDLTEQGRMNVLRIWGEGHIPPQEFYDECDRRGILVWQDFMFGYGMHPTGLPDYDENCQLEIDDMIRRLRNHPCLLLWVGGNENHMGVDFAGGKSSPLAARLFHEIMPQAVARLDPQRLFHPSSPYGGRVPNWPLEGDWHDYTTLKFCPEASVPTYASEVGRVSAPSLASMRRFLSDDELWPPGFDPAVRTPGRAAWPAMWQYRSVGGSWDKVGDLAACCDPASAADLIRVLGTAHGQYLRDRVERERRGVPDGSPDGSRRCWGNMVWRLNDSWPIIYWSVIDYYLEPKMAYYYLRRAYDPVLVSFERTGDQIAVWVVNDSPEPVAGTLKVRRRTFAGDAPGELQAEVSLAPGQSRRCLSTTDLGPISLRTEYLEAAFAGRTVTYLLADERYQHLPAAHLTARVAGRQIELSTDKFAAQVTLEAVDASGAVFEDNFFDMPPGEKRTIAIIDSAGAKEIAVRALNGEAVRVKVE